MKLTVRDGEYHYGAEGNSGFSKVNFSLEDGEVVTILGPNGCGKTTLLKCVNNLLRLQKGSVSLNNMDISHLSRSQVAKVVGYVPQIHQPAFPFSVLDAVLVGRTPHLGLLESPKPEDVRIADQVIQSLGISHLREKPYTQLSGGERQLVIFARVLTQQPALLLLDEPTSHLDFGNQIRLLRVVKKLAVSGLPVLMTSHFPDHAFLMSNKVVIMKKGEIIDIGRPENVITEDNLEKIYGIKVKVIDVNSGINRKVCIPLEDSGAAFEIQNY
jgi:iron complex transport system ATP-binding protein